MKILHEGDFYSKKWKFIDRQDRKKFGEIILAENVSMM